MLPAHWPDVNERPPLERLPRAGWLGGVCAGIARHLKEYHFRDPSSPWHPRNRGACQWRDAEGVCHKELNYASFGKHVAAVHLQSTAKACPYCFQNLGRADSLERHIKNYCSRSGRCEKK